MKKIRHSIVKKVHSISPVWGIPIIAFVIASWLGIESWRQSGQQIEIIFSSAAGIEVNETEVRLKDVPVGKVTAVRLSKDLSEVKVKVSLYSEMTEHLSEHTRFWLVTPRISIAGVSNLGTLVSGVYIVMDPGKKGEITKSFRGLNEPPAVKSDEKGTQFILTTKTLGSLDIGSPVYYRQVKVGEVVNYRLASSGNEVEIRIFIQSPHDSLVNTRSRFWNVSGFDFTVGADGLKADMASLVSLLSGGVAFDNSTAYEVAEQAKSNHQFYLHPDKESVTEGQYDLRYYYLLKFSHSVKGLQLGAPVEFRGVKVGEVVDIVLSSIENQQGSLHVYIALEPQRMNEDLEFDRKQSDELVELLVKQGLRGELKLSNMLLGTRYIDLYFPENTEPGEFILEANYAEIPSVDDPLDLLNRQVASVANKIDQIPIDEIGKDLALVISNIQQMTQEWEKRKTASAVHGTFANLESATKEMDETVANASVALKQLTQTLKSIDHTLAPDSQLHYEMIEMLNAVTEASDSFDRFLEELYRYPNSLLMGVEKND